MTDLDLTKLREIAAAATPGPWGVYDANEGMSPPRPYWSVANNEFHNPTNLDALAIDISIDYGDKDDAAHIAAFDPPTVLALIDEVERLRAVVDEVAERAWDHAVGSMRYEDGSPVEIVSVTNPYRIKAGDSDE